MNFTTEQASAYLAGMIDGEGNVGAYGKDPKRGRVIKITNCDTGLIDACAGCCDILSITYHVKQHHNSRVNQNPAWVILIYGRDNFGKAARLPLQSAKKREAIQSLAKTFRNPVPSKEEFTHAYCVLNMSYVDMCKHFGIKSTGSINYWLKKYGIPSRTLQEAATAHWRKRRGP
jgi:hypothetical protein